MLKTLANLWKSKPEGKSIASGVVDLGFIQVRCVLLKNDKKDNEKAPDYKLLMEQFEAPRELQENQSDSHDPFAQDTGAVMQSEVDNSDLASQAKPF